MILIVWTKICGVQSLSIARQLARLNPEAIGLNRFPGSSRYLSLSVAKRLACQIRETNPDIEVVTVYVNPPRQLLDRDYRAIRPDIIQLHGEETVEYLAGLSDFPARIIKAFRVKKSFESDQLDGYNCWAYLFDAHKSGEYGGTGHLAPWEQVAKLTTTHRVILAGGLTPENIAAALRRVDPWGVDICSGVETGGKKDLKKLQGFLQKINLYSSGEKK